MNAAFTDRRDAGRQLAARLSPLALQPGVVVLGLPRGGVPVAFEIAGALAAPLEVFAVRKLAVPGHEDMAMGAVATGGVRVLNEDVIHMLRVRADVLSAVTGVERRELERCERLYRDGRRYPTIGDATVVLVDDGLVTGATMRAAVQAVKALHPASIVVAAPVISRDAHAVLARLADAVVAVTYPESLGNLALWYQHFEPPSDDEIRALLADAATRPLALHRPRHQAEGADVEDARHAVHH